MDIVDYIIKLDYIKLIHNMFSFTTSIILVIFGLNMKKLMKSSLNNVDDGINEVYHIEEYLYDNIEDMHIQNKISEIHDSKTIEPIDYKNENINNRETYNTKRLYILI